MYSLSEREKKDALDMEERKDRERDVFLGVCLLVEWDEAVCDCA